MSKIRKLIAVLAIMAILVGSTVAMADTVTPAGNTYGFAGTNGKYYTDYPSFADEQQAARELAIEAASEGFTLLKNENDALPLKKGAYVSLFGMHSVNLVASTVGSAAGSTGANGLEESTLRMAMEKAGFKVNSKLIDLYTKHEALGTTENELPMEYYTPAVVSTYNGYGMNGYDSIGAIAVTDATCTDARVIEIADIQAGNYYQAYEYGYTVSEEDAAKLAEFGLTLDKVMTDFGHQYDVNTAVTVSGTPTKTGTVEIGVTLTVPLVRGFGNAFPNNVKVVSPCVIQIPSTVVLTIGE